MEKEFAIEQLENNFLHLNLSAQEKEARKLKFSAQGCHEVHKKKKRRLFEILNPQIVRPHR